MRAVISRIACDVKENLEARSNVRSTELVKVEVFPADPRLSSKVCGT